MKEPKKGTGKLSEIRKNPGESNAYKYKDVKSFAGPDKSFPIDSLARARNALARAHFAKDLEAVKRKVYAKYPELKKRKEERSKKEKD